MAQVKKWWQVYCNDEEKRFFVGKDGKSGLVRNSQFEWRTTDSLSRESGLTKTKTEEIIAKYHKAGLVIQHSNDPEKWGYWEKVSTQDDKKTTKSVSDEDKEKRINKAGKKK